MRRSLAVAVTAVLSIGASAASASHTNQADPNDVDGRLDVDSVRFRHDADPYRWVFRTYRGWRPKEIWDRGFFLIELDTRGSAEVDYVAMIRSTGRDLEGLLLRMRRDGKHVNLLDLDVRKAGPSGAAIAVPPDALSFGRARTAFLWSASTLFTGRACRATCIDRVPDEGMVELELPSPPVP